MTKISLQTRWVCVRDPRNPRISTHQDPKSPLFRSRFQPKLWRGTKNRKKNTTIFPILPNTSQYFPILPNTKKYMASGKAKTLIWFNEYPDILSRHLPWIPMYSRRISPFFREFLSFHDSIQYWHLKIGISLDIPIFGEKQLPGEESKFPRPRGPLVSH